MRISKKTSKSMKIYTSYFANVKNVPEHISPVSIARFPPRWFKGLCFMDIAPPKELLWKSKQGKITEDEYTAQYISCLERKFTPESLIRKLKTLFGGKDIILLCFERRGEFCHRRLLAEWLQSGLNILVEEL